MNIWESDAETQQTRINMFRAYVENSQMFQQVIETNPAAVKPLTLFLKFVMDSFRMPSSDRNALDDSLTASEAAVIAKASQPPAPPKPTMEEVELEKAKAMQITALSRQKEAETTAQVKQSESQIRINESQNNFQTEQLIQQGKLRDIEAKDKESMIKAEIAKLQLMLEEKKLQLEAEKAGEGNAVKLQIGKMQQETNLIKADKEAFAQRERSFENAVLERERMQEQRIKRGDENGKRFNVDRSGRGFDE